MAALLGQVGGGQIDDDPAAGHGQAETGEGGADPLAALGDGLVAEAHQHELHLAGGQLDFDVDAAGLDALKGYSDDAGSHANP